MLRKFKGFRLGRFEIVNHLILDLNGHKAWIFHGDVFDMTMKHAKWLAKLGGIGYDILIMMNTMINWINFRLGRGRISFSKRIKNSVKGAVKHINKFEETVADIAIGNGYDYVVCGHIHQPQIRKIANKYGRQITYFNSGDWIENLTALEYKSDKWLIYDYMEDALAQSVSQKEGTADGDLFRAGYRNKQLFKELLEEFQVLQHQEIGLEK
jgi:UDP-2,3-diacylglucosamine pyrophosphatase LpxH